MIGILYLLGQDSKNKFNISVSWYPVSAVEFENCWMRTFDMDMEFLVLYFHGFFRVVLISALILQLELYSAHRKSPV